MSLSPESLASFGEFAPPERLVRDWRECGFYDDALIGRNLAWVSKRLPDKIAVVDGSNRITYRQLDNMAGSLASAFAGIGLKQGDVISWQTPNWWESIVIALAAWRFGAVNNPILPIYREHELIQITSDLRPEIVAAPQQFKGVAHQQQLDDVLDSVQHEPLLRIGVRGAIDGWHRFDELIGSSRRTVPLTADPGSPSVVAYTSGTTTRAKGVVVSNRQLLAETRQMVLAWGISWQDTTFMPAPLAHLTGLTVGLTVPLSVGGTVTLMDVWDPEKGARIAESESAVFSSGTPTFLEELCNVYEEDPHVHPSLKQFSVGGSIVSPTLIDRCERVGIRAFRCYGMTEHLTITIMNGDYPLSQRRDTDGLLAPGTEISCVDEEGKVLSEHQEGEIRVRGPERMLGYVDPTDSANSIDRDEGWLTTGDIGFVDSDGFVQITGRTKDIINRGGEKFSAREMEDALASHESIRQVAIVPASDERLGEVPVAFLVSRADVEAPSGEELSEYVKDKGLARQKTPVAWHFIEQMPMTPFGKVRKQELLEQLSEGNDWQLSEGND